MLIHNLLLKNKTKHIYSGLNKHNIPPVASDLFPKSISQVHQGHYRWRNWVHFSMLTKRPEEYQYL